MEMKRCVTETLKLPGSETMAVTVQLGLPERMKELPLAGMAEVFWMNISSQSSCLISAGHRASEVYKAM